MFRAIGPSAQEASTRSAADVAEQARALAAEALKQNAATAATDDEVEAIRAVLATADASEVAARIAAITGEQAARVAADALKQDAATAATDAELAALSQSGTLAARPAAASVIAGTLYFATDDNGGTLARSTGSAWAAVAPGAAVAGGTIIDATSRTSDATSTTVYPTRTDVTSPALSVVDSVGGRSVIVEAGGPRLLHGVSGGSAIVSIMEGSTELQFFRFDTAAASQRTGWYAATPVIAQSSGSHTYKIALSVLTAGTVTLGGAVGSPSWVRIRGA